MRLSIALALAALAAGCGPSTADPQNPASAGDGAGPGRQATDFTLRDMEGRDVRLSDHAGKVVLLDFWATWCIPCEALVPHLVRMYDANKDKGFVVLGISMDGPETIANVPAAARRQNVTFPILLDDETRVVAIYNPKRTAPLSILIDRKGNIFRVRQGYNVGDEKLIEADVTNLLAQ